MDKNRKHIWIVFCGAYYTDGNHADSCWRRKEDALKHIQLTKKAKFSSEQGFYCNDEEQMWYKIEKYTLN